MADLSSQEKRNLSFKHVLGIAGTNNLDGANGKLWFEESISSTHPIYLPKARSDIIPEAGNITTARSNAVTFDSVEDRSQGESITLTPNGSNWDINTSVITPEVGYQITDTHPNPTYVKSITSVTDNGGGSFTVTLNNNTGVSPGSAVLHSRVYLTKDPSSNEKAWMTRVIQGDFFSDRVREFLSPIEFGRGYTVNVFQSDGTQVQLTEGAWFFNWQEGLLIFGDGFTSPDLGYSEPLYVEGFRYVGKVGASGAAIDVLHNGNPIVTGASSIDFGEGLSVSGNGTTAVVSVTGTISNILDGVNFGDTLFWNSNNEQWEPSEELNISGSTVTVNDRLIIEGSVILPSGTRPNMTTTPGLLGEVRFDPNYFYVHVGDGGWRRMELACFGSSPGSLPPPSPSSYLGLAAVAQCPVSSGTNLDLEQDPLTLESSSFNEGGIFSTSVSGVQVSERGLCKVTWNVEAERSGGSTQRRILTTSLLIDGIEVPNTKCHGYFRDFKNNSANSQNSILVEITAPNQTISIKSNQTGSGDPSGSSTFLSRGGHLLVEFIGAR